MSKNFEAWNIDVIDPGSSTRDEFLLNLVGWGVLAPSSHNTQPWRFILCPESNLIDVCILKKSLLKHSDKKGRQGYISMGCALYNIIKASEYYNLDTRVEYYPSNFYPLPLARLFLSQSGEGLNEKIKKVLDAMKSRRMNRAKFYPLQPLPEDFIKDMESTAKDLGLAFNSIIDSPTKFALAEIQYLADRSVIAINDFRRELGEFFLVNDTDKCVGMPGNTFGLSDEMAKYAHDELNKVGAFDPDLAFGMAASGRDGIKSSPLVGVISIPEDSPLWWIKAGMAFQEIILSAQERGISVAVHAAIVEVEMFNKLLRIRLRQGQRPTVIFRVGYANEKRPRSPRLGAAEVSEIRRNRL